MLFIFDMGGVVTSTFNSKAIYDYLNISLEQFDDICKDDGLDIFSQLTKGQITIKDFWDEFNNRSKKFNAKPVTTDLFRLFFHPELNNETVKLINALRKKNRVVCGTNTIQSHWENHLERGDYSYFDQTYASNKIGQEKPDSLFYKTIMMAEGYSPENVFFTDDKIENINAAKDLGINAVLFSDAKMLYKEWKKYI